MKGLLTAVVVFGMFVAGSSQAKTLKIGYSDWPGWIAWEIGIQKGWFDDAGADVEFVWLDYLGSMEAFARNELDAVCMTNGDALVTGAGLGEGVPPKPSVCVLLNDFSYGNDMVVAAPGIKNFADLAGQTVALEEGFVPHLLFLTGMKEEGVPLDSVKIINQPTDKTPIALKEGLAQAISAWQPNSGEALKALPGATEIFSSADVPGIIFDGLYVDRTSAVRERREWQKVVKVWYQIVSFMKDEENLNEVLEILSARAGLTPTEYADLLEGTYILSLEEARRCWGKRSSISSIYGSSQYSDQFNVENGVYKEPSNIDSYYDPSFLPAARGERK